MKNIQLDKMSIFIKFLLLRRKMGKSEYALAHFFTILHEITLTYDI